jgi:hypothetical protein
MLGLTGKALDWSHEPALQLRAYDEHDYDPPQHDPRFIRPRTKEAHAVLTNGTAVPLSGDKSQIAKVRRVREGQAAFRARLLAKEAGEESPRSRWPSRPFGAQTKCWPKRRAR